MKHCIKEYLHRGLIAAGFGPIVLAVVYLVLHREGAVAALSVPQVCTGIFSLEALAFIAGGMNVLYQIERLPLMWAILIHGGALYISYLITYLINGWLTMGAAPVLIFSAAFVIGYLIIWAVIYSVTRRSTSQVNSALKRQHRSAEE